MSMKADARALLVELNEFTTAAAALERLFGYEVRQRDVLLEQLLAWQSTQASTPLAEVVHDFESSEDDLKKTKEAEEVSYFKRLFLVMGKPALMFATSIYDEELALTVWRGLIGFHQSHPSFNLVHQVLENEHDSHGFCSLHYAIEAQMESFLVEVCQTFGSDIHDRHHTAAKKFAQRIVTKDVVLPMGKSQIQGRNITSGGRTLLHVAASNGELTMMKTLLGAPFWMDATTKDWDGNTPYQLALLYGHHEAANFLQGLTSEPRPNDEELTAMRSTRDARAKDRYINHLDAKPAFRDATIFPAIWSHDECKWVLDSLEKVTIKRGWCKQRHAAYPTTDVPCYQVVPIDSWVRATIRERLFKQIYQRYNISSHQKLAFRELFYVKYEAQMGESAELGLHCDGSELSFNILLNSADEFMGGGTFFEATKETIHITQGDAVVHSGKVRHAGAPVITGKRLILVGFLDILDRVF